MLPQTVLSSFSQANKEVGNKIFEFHLLSYFVRLREDSLSSLVCPHAGKRICDEITCFPNKKKIKNVYIYGKNLCQYKCWEYCFKVQNFTRYPDANI